MKNKLIVLCLIFACLTGCGEKPGDTIIDMEITPDVESQMTDDGAITNTIYANGPYGQLSLTVPDDWEYTTYDWDQKGFDCGLYGIRLCPNGKEKGYITVSYYDSFGVCGTDLTIEDIKIAGRNAEKGTYFGDKPWDYISFKDDYEGVVINCFDAEDWKDSYLESLDGILDSITFNPDECNGCASTYTSDSENNDIGVELSLEDVTPSGATVVLYQYDNEHNGICGDDFTLEKRDGDNWKSLTPVTDNYGFNDIAHLIDAGQKFTADTPWDWIYGELEPGDYRLVKTVNFDKEYTLYAEFIVR